MARLAAHRRPLRGERSERQLSGRRARGRVQLLAASLCTAIALVGGLSASSVVPAAGSRVATTARPRALVQAGNSKTTCLYSPLGAQLTAATAATGVQYDCVEVFDTTDPDWNTWDSPWFTVPRYGYTYFVDGAPTERTLIITKDLVPDNVSASEPNWRALGASGYYDKYYRVLATNLVAAGFGDSVIRLGPEMNGQWETDWIGTTPTEQKQWALLFARAVRIMRAVPGAHFLFDWNVNAGYQVIPLANFYPGNKYVDIIGIDAYDEASIPLPPVGAPTRWTTLATEPLGLDQITEFAVENHKPISLPEWGTLTTIGDDGNYVDHIGQYVDTHDVAYESYYDANDEHITPLAASAPQTLAAYITFFGPHSATARYQRAFTHRT